MSDLDKLMKKLKTDDPKADDPTPVAQAPAPVVAQAPAPVVAPAIDDDDEDDDEEEESEVIAEGGADPQEPIENEEHSVEAEVGILQNNGIFRRELLLVKKEQVDVLKIIAQTLLDIKTKLMGEDGKKN